MKKILFIVLFLLISIHGYCGVDLNGDVDYISIGDVAAVDTATELSGSIWVYHDTLSADQALFSKLADDGSDGMLLWADTSAGATGRTDTYTITINEDSSASLVVTYSASSAAVTTTWTHVAFTWDGGSATGLKLYINGVLDENSPEDSTDVTSFDSGASLLKIGSSTLGPRPVDGRLSDAALWNKALTAGEIALIYNSKVKRMPLQIQPSSLIGYWALDDFSDGTALNTDAGKYKDMSSNSNNGQGVDADEDSLNIGEQVLSYP